MSSGVYVIFFFSPAAALSHLAVIRQQRKFISQSLLYLRHLREQADGHGQGEAEGNQAHEAVDGQQQSAVALQESQPTRIKTEIKRKREPVWIDSTWLLQSQASLFLDLVENVMCRFWGRAILHN